MEKFKVLRASKAGNPCSRNIWYSVNGYKPKYDENSNSRWILEVGTCLEPMIVYRLTCEDWDVEYNGGSQEAPIEYKIPLNGGEFAGHPDCFMSKGKIKNVLADIKTMNDYSFKKWKKNGSLKDKPSYVDQLHIYAAGAMAEGRKVEHLAIVGFNKNNSDMYIDIFDYDPERYEAIKQRSEGIFEAVEPPNEKPKEKWCCQYCEYGEICELNQKDTAVGDDVVKTEDKDIINAVDMLKEARDLSKAGKDLEAEAKKVLDEKVRKAGIKSLFANGMNLKLIESVRTSFDMNAFAEKHPMLAEILLKKFNKVSSSLSYRFAEAE